MVGEQSHGEEDEVDVDPDEEDMNAHNLDLSHDGSMVISESNESMMELKKKTTIPILKNND